MTVQRQRRGIESSGTEQRRLRLRDWLEMRIGDQKYPGLRWDNEREGIFRIPWKHGARHGWREEEDARLFREWSEHTGASPKDVKQHKANFRCALNSLRDIERLPVSNNGNRGDDAYRLYRLLPKRIIKSGKKWIRKRTPSSPKGGGKSHMTQKRRIAPSFPEQQTSPFSSAIEIPQLSCFTGSSLGTFPPTTNPFQDLSQLTKQQQTSQHAQGGFGGITSRHVGLCQPAVSHTPSQYTYASTPYTAYYSNPSPAHSSHFGESATDLLHANPASVYSQQGSTYNTVTGEFAKTTCPVDSYGNYSGVGFFASSHSEHNVTDMMALANPAPIDTPPIEDDVGPINYSMAPHDLTSLSPVGMDLSTCQLPCLPDDATKYMEGGGGCQQNWDVTASANDHTSTNFEIASKLDYDNSSNIYRSLEMGDVELPTSFSYLANRSKFGSNGNISTSDTFLNLAMEDFPEVKTEYLSDAISSDVESVFGEDVQIPEIFRSFGSANKPPLLSSSSSTGSVNVSATRLPSAYTLLSASPNGDELTGSPPWRGVNGSDEVFQDNFCSVSPAVVYGS